MTVKECSSKEDTDKWKDENGGSWIRDCRRSSSYNDSDELPSAKRGICWFHVCQNFDKELPKSKIYENACNEVKEDAKIWHEQPATNFMQHIGTRSGMNIGALWVTCISSISRGCSKRITMVGSIALPLQSVSACPHFLRIMALREPKHAELSNTSMEYIPGTQEFMDVLNKLKEESNNKGPILLHCSAGCGRTGSVIAIDIFRELLTSKVIYC
uniref:Protein tyrosine phosphatase n=1 Tax=Ditylenchus dipsaci TaxID=166011 RepID=A0A915CMP8_9BILA